MPGLIDTHFHTAQQLLRGKISELSRRRHLRLPIWQNYLIPFESVLDEEDVYLSGLLAYSNMLKAGTTCFAEAGGPHPDQMGRAADEVGIRGFLALSTVDMGDSMPRSMMMTTQEAIERNLALVQRWKEHDRVRGWLSLRQLIVCSQALWEAFRDLSDQLGVRVHTHLAEGTYEVDYATARWGKRPAEHLEGIGFVGPRMHAAHSVLLSHREVDLYAERQVTVAHCPIGNYLIGPPKIHEMWRRGITVGIGSDGASSGSIDLFQATHATWVAQQAIFATPWHDRSLFTAEDLLQIATIGGARAIGEFATLGSLEVGKQADILMINPEELDLQPVYDPLFTVSRCITGRDVETVLVNGQVVVRNRQLLTVDEGQLKSSIRERLPRIMGRFEMLVP
jgi:5-methylthioadenosine/S-adenosylhomocysteine deaminase